VGRRTFAGLEDFTFGFLDPINLHWLVLGLVHILDCVLTSVPVFAVGMPAVSLILSFLRVSDLQQKCPASAPFNKLHVQKPDLIEVGVSYGICEHAGIGSGQRHEATPSVSDRVDTKTDTKRVRKSIVG
jgi:hypothetical protein